MTVRCSLASAGSTATGLVGSEWPGPVSRAAPSDHWVHEPMAWRDVQRAVSTDARWAVTMGERREVSRDAQPEVSRVPRPAESTDAPPEV